jgi:predicted RNase H-like nuclease (RuvC/YqgF family)
MMVDRTNAERQRRYIARLKASATGVSNAAAEITRLTAELADAKQHIAKLERKKAHTATPRAEESDAEGEIMRLETELNHARKWVEELEGMRNTRLLDNSRFQKQPKKCIETLAKQGRSHVVTFSVVTVAAATNELEKLLFDYGVWQGSARRKTDLDRLDSDRR